MGAVAVVVAVVVAVGDRERERGRDVGERTLMDKVTSPQFAILTGFRVLPDCEPLASIFLMMSMPDDTFPNTTCFPLRKEVVAVQMKNWLPLVCGPGKSIGRWRPF